MRLPHWVFDVETIASPWMKDTRFREAVVGQPLHPFVCWVVPLVPSHERAPPKVLDMVTVGVKCRKGGLRHVVVEEPCYNARQPLSLFEN